MTPAAFLGIGVLIGALLGGGFGLAWGYLTGDRDSRDLLARLSAANERLLDLGDPHLADLVEWEAEVSS